MPTISKQKGGMEAGNGILPPTTGLDGLLSRGVAVSKLNSTFIKMLLYGQNRVGKTRLACGFPKPLLLLSFEPNVEGGAKSVRRFGAVTFLPIKKKEEAVMLADHMKGDLRSPWRNGKEVTNAHGHSAWIGETWKTIVIDTVTSMQDVILAELMNLDAVPVQLNWGSVPEGFYAARSEQAKEVTRKYTDLSLNVVINAKEKDHNPPKQMNEKGKSRVVGNKLIREVQAASGANLDQGSFFSADVGAATAQWLGDACDCICHLQVVKEIKEIKTKVTIMDVEEEQVQLVETGKLVQRLRCGAADGQPFCHPNFASGMRSERPEKVPEFLFSPTWEKLKAVIEGTYQKED